MNKQVQDFTAEPRLSLQDLQTLSMTVCSLLSGVVTLSESSDPRDLDAGAASLRVALKYSGELSSALDSVNIHKLDVSEAIKGDAEKSAKQSTPQKPLVSPVADNKPKLDALASLYQIHSLAQFGIAASDTTSGIDIKYNSSLYEEISRLADAGAETVETMSKTAA